MKRKSTIIICAVAATVIAAALFSAIWFGPKASLKRELNISVPKNAKIVKYDIGFWIIGFELSGWKIKLDPDQYPAFKEELLNSLSEHPSYSFFNDVYDDEADWEKQDLRDLYENTNGFSGFYNKEDEFQWSAYAFRGREPWLINSITRIHAVATLSDDGYYYVSIRVM